VVTRRALLGGAVVLLAGCGEEEDDTPTASEALLRQFAAESELAGATSSLPTGAPRSAAPALREISARAKQRAETVGAAAAAAGAPATLEAELAERVDAAGAVALAQAAIVAHVTALPSLTGRELRQLGAEMVTGAAADTALLSDALRIPVADAFPGTPQ
jgi:hypothetical protein